MKNPNGSKSHPPSCRQQLTRSPRAPRNQGTTPAPVDAPIDKGMRVGAIAVVDVRLPREEGVEGALEALPGLGVCIAVRDWGWVGGGGGSCLVRVRLLRLLLPLLLRRMKVWGSRDLGVRYVEVGRWMGLQLLSMRFIHHLVCIMDNIPPCHNNHDHNRNHTPILNIPHALILLRP